MAYYVKNKEKNGIEIYFDGKPEEVIRDELKKNKWRWTNVRHCWWHYYNDESEEFAKRLCNGHEEQFPLNTNEQTYTSQTSSLRSRGKSINQSNKIKPVSFTKASVNQTLDLKRVMQAVGGVYVNRDKLRGVMKDLYPQSILDTNILLAVYESGIPKVLSKKKSITSLEFTHYVDQIVREYGLQTKYAISGIKKWLEYDKIETQTLTYNGTLKNVNDKETEANISKVKLPSRSGEIQKNCNSQSGLEEFVFDGKGNYPVLYDSNNIYIEFRGIYRKQYGGYMITNLYIENKMNEAIIIQLTKGLVNGWQIEFANGSTTLSPQTRYQSGADNVFLLDLEDLKFDKVDSIETFGFTMEIKRSWNVGDTIAEKLVRIQLTHAVTVK